MKEPSHLHPALSESEETSLGADRLDVGTREFILSRLYCIVLTFELLFVVTGYLRHDIFFKVYVVSQGHFSWKKEVHNR